MTRPFAVLLPCAALLSIAVSLSAQQPDTSRFEHRNVMIAMRDGVKLNTEIFIPRGATERLPIILNRTPYQAPTSIAGRMFMVKELADDGFIFAFQDIRGRYKSEGTFVMQRPPRADRSDPKAIDEGTDAYDTIDWLVKNVPGNNGRVGMFGVSYDGWTTAMALLEPHPALRAASPQASPADMFLGDDFFHNGAFRLSYGFEYATMMETGKETTPFTFDRYDTYDWYLGVGPLSNINAKYLKGRVPTWNDFTTHHAYDEFWKRQTIVRYIDRPTNVGTLNVAGWWDQEDFYGPLAIYLAREKYDTARLNFLVVGPWNHGGWNRPEGTKMGNIDFGMPTSKYFREKIQLPFFAYYLKGKGTLKQPEALTFAAGANEWREWNAWPPRAAHGVTQKQIYFHANGGLSFEPPATNPDTIDQYISDPAKPVPYRARPIQWTYDSRGSNWYTWLTEDQRFVHNRPDVLSYQTAPLTEDVEIAGEVMANLFASTSGSDTDWIVKLIDVYPDSMPDAKMGGYQFMVSNEVFRGRFRDSFEMPKALQPNAVTNFRYSLRTQNYRFRKGHRIMVQVQSSWFPLIDRNPQTFVPNIFQATEKDFRPATIRVVRSPGKPSGLSLPVVSAPVP